MVCANNEARYVREFDLLRHKLGLDGMSALYPPSLVNELRASADKFLTDRNPVRPADLDDCR